MKGRVGQALGGPAFELEGGILSQQVETPIPYEKFKLPQHIFYFYLQKFLCHSCLKLKGGVESRDEMHKHLRLFCRPGVPDGHLVLNGG